jgi:threonine/homoserine/homoserine lactone efflux protein
MANLPGPVIEILFKGIEFGVILSFLVGPVFFTILQTSVERGFWIGVLVAVGVSASDILYVVICFFGFTTFMADPSVNVYMGYGGGAILIAFGLYHLLVKARGKQPQSGVEVVEGQAWRYVAKGFLINVMSPMVPLFWIGAVSIATVDYEYTTNGAFGLFFGAVLATVLVTDIGKAYLAGRLSRLVTPRSLMIMNAALGVILIGFGGRLIFAAIHTS